MPYVKNDLDRVIDEVCKVVGEHSKYNATPSRPHEGEDAFYLYRRQICSEAGVVGEVYFGDDRACVFTFDVRMIGMALYCDPDFFEKIVKIVDKLL